MSELLSQDERDALMETIHEEDKNEQVAVNLASNQRILTSLLPQLQRDLDKLALSLASEFTRILHKKLSVHCFSQVEDNATVTQKLNCQAMVLHLSNDETWDFGFLSFTPELCFIIVETLFGATLDFAADTFNLPRQYLTHLEAQAILPFANDFAAIFSKFFLKENSEKPVLMPLPLNLEKNNHSQQWIRTTFNFTAIKSTFSLDLIVGLEACKKRLFPKICQIEDAVMHKKLLQNLPGTPVEMIVMLGHKDITLNELVAMQPGQVMWLNQLRNQPLPIFIEDCLAFWGNPHIHHDNLAVMIAEPML